MALSMDIRKKVVKAIELGMSRRQAAARFDIGPATAVRWAKRVEITGDAGPLKMGGDRRSSASRLTAISSSRKSRQSRT